MAKTTIHGWTLPDGTSRPVVHTDLKSLADQMDGQVPFVCTSTTRPAHSIGLIIFETDTLRTRKSNGNRWMVIDQPWKKYTPNLGGTWNLGTTGSEVTGAYEICGDEWVNVQARVTWGAGAAAPQTFPYVSISLPFTVAMGADNGIATEGIGNFMHQGMGTHLYDGFGGGIRNVCFAGSAGNNAVQVFANPNGADYMNAIAGYGFKQGTVLCMNFSYRGVIPD